MDIFIIVFNPQNNDGISQFLTMVHQQNQFRELGEIDSIDSLLEIDDRENILLATKGEWHIIMGQTDFLYESEVDFTEILNILSEQGKAVSIVTQDTAGGFWFEVYENGKAVRKWAGADGEILDEMGTPLAEEKIDFSARYLEHELDDWDFIEILEDITKK